jgi:rhodanese-related sulfurtransferase
MKTEILGSSKLDVLTPEEVKQRFDNNEIVLIDVRTPAEYEFEHIPGALLFPLSRFDPSKLPAQDKKPIVLHCGSDMRSHKAAQRCADAGIKILAHMEGGFGAWKKASLPYVAINPDTGSLVEKP